MAGLPGFPRNWRVEDANGRRFLVRKLAPVVSETFQADRVTQEHISLVERAIRELNPRYWEVGETVLKVAIDPDTTDPFILDLSNAGVRRNAAEKPYAGDQLLFEGWANQFEAGRPLVALRRSARKLVSSAAWSLTPHGLTHRWVYGSPCPMDDLWPGAAIADAIYVPANRQATGVDTWVVVPSPLSEAVISSHRLVWGWAPIAYEKREIQLRRVRPSVYRWNGPTSTIWVHNVGRNLWEAYAGERGRGDIRLFKTLRAVQEHIGEKGDQF